MTASAKLSLAEFETKLDRFLQAAEKKSGFVIDEGLNVVQKSGISWCMRWCVLWLQDTASYYLGREIAIFNHVRIEKVAQSFLKQCQTHSDYFIPTTFSDFHVYNKAAQILAKLNQKTNKKHDEFIQKLKIELHRSLPPKAKSTLPPTSTLSILLDGKKTSPTLTLPQGFQKTLGLDDAKKKQLEEAVLGTLSILQEPKKLSSYEVRINKDSDGRQLQILDKKESPSKIISSLPIPLTVHFTFNKKGIEEITVISKEVIAKGGGRQVRRGWDMVKGEWAAIKRSLSDEEEELLIYFSKNPKRGLPSHIEWSDCIKHKGEVKIIEPHCMGTLFILLNNGSLDDPWQKCQIMEDLLYGLLHLHDYKLSETTGFVKDKETTVKNIPAYSSDVKISNVLVNLCPNEIDPDKERFGAFHSDFDTACILDICEGTPGFFSPEAMAHLLSDPTKEQNTKHNLQYGQKRDMWDLGLVFVAILAGYTSKRVTFDIPPLAFLEDFFINNHTEKAPDKDIATISQDTVTKDIASLKSSMKLASDADGVFLSKLWELTNNLLSVDPKTRLTAKEALDKFLVIKKERYGI